MYFILCQLVYIFTGTWIVNSIRQSNNTISINKIKHLYKDPSNFCFIYRFVPINNNNNKYVIMLYNNNRILDIRLAANPNITIFYYLSNRYIYSVAIMWDSKIIINYQS